MERAPKNETSPLDSVGATRKLMEHVARKSLLSRPEVTPRFGASVTELILEKDKVAGGSQLCSVTVVRLRTILNRTACSITLK
jgi:hypothetical protein